VDRIIDQLKLGPYTAVRAGYLSSGNAQRLGLAKALIHNPRLLILDEPSNGLDPAGIVEIRELLSDLSENHKTTIFISSHILAEISKIAHRIGIIHHGKLIEEIRAKQLEQRIQKRLKIKTRNNEQAIKILGKKGLAPVADHNGELILTDKNALDHPDDIAALLVSESVPPLSLYQYEEDLEDYFLRIIHENDGTP
jgi:ABC-2 type transport system ATP-binding protein